MVDASVSISINGTERKISIDPNRFLLDAIRKDLRRAGAKHLCGEGRCGGCVVLLDGKRVLSCEIPIAQVERRKIATIQ